MAAAPVIYRQRDWGGGLWFEGIFDSFLVLKPKK